MLAYAGAAGLTVLWLPLGEQVTWYVTNSIMSYFLSTHQSLMREVSRYVVWGDKRVSCSVEVTRE